MNAAQAKRAFVSRRKRLAKKIENRRAAGRLGGLRSVEVRREKRLAEAAGEPTYPTKPRWSIGIRDNWSGENGWFVWSSWRDTFRRLRCVMANLQPAGKPSR